MVQRLEAAAPGNKAIVGTGARNSVQLKAGGAARASGSASTLTRDMRLNISHCR